MEPKNRRRRRNKQSLTAKCIVFARNMLDGLLGIGLGALAWIGLIGAGVGSAFQKLTRGTRAARMHDGIKRPARSKKDARYRAAMVALVCVMAVSLCMLISILVRSVRTHLLNEEMSQRRAALLQETQMGAQSGMQRESQAQTEAQPQTQPKPDAAGESGRTQASAGTIPAHGEVLEPRIPTLTDTEAALATPTPSPKDVVRSTLYHVTGGEPLAHMAAFYEENSDLIGWLEIPEILDLPVVYKNNSYYLSRDFDKQKNASGTLFLDVNHPFSEWTQNLLLHGHNMKDGTMFGRLVHYAQDIDYLKRNAFVRFDTLWREEQYVIVSVMRVSLDVEDEAFFNYFSYPTFSSDAEFEHFARRLQLRSMYAIPIDIESSDALLTLSTCLDEDRLVIVCRRIREGESRASLRERINLAVRQ